MGCDYLWSIYGEQPLNQITENSRNLTKRFSLLSILFLSNKNIFRKLRILDISVSFGENYFTDVGDICNPEKISIKHKISLLQRNGAKATLGGGESSELCFIIIIMKAVNHTSTVMLQMSNINNIQIIWEQRRYINCQRMI